METFRSWILPYMSGVVTREVAASANGASQLRVKASIAFITGMRVGGAKVSATTQRCGIWCDHPG